MQSFVFGIYDDKIKNCKPFNLIDCPSGNVYTPSKYETSSPIQQTKQLEIAQLKRLK